MKWPTRCEFEAVFPWIIAFNFVWIVGCITASILHRRRLGRPIFPRAPPDALYLERFGSGRSLDNLIGRIGGARNCLIIAVTDEVLLVSPIFPFNMMFLPDIYGLEHRIPRSAIRSVARKSGILGERAVVAFDTDKPHAMELRIRDMSAFMEALGRE